MALWSSLPSFLLATICLIDNYIFCQEKSWYVGHSLTRASFDGILNKGNGDEAFFPLGAGFSLIRKRGFKKSEVSFLTYGLEISSVRHAFYLGSVSDWGINTSVKIPVTYRFETTLTKAIKGIINVGLSIHSSTNGTIKTKVFNNSTAYEIRSVRSIVPHALVSGGFSVRTRKQRQFEILLGLSKGFVPIQKVIYTTENPFTETTLFSNSTYAFLVFNWRIFKRRI